MNVKNLTPFPFAAKVTSRHPPQPEMCFIVRGKFSLIPNDTMVVVPGEYEPIDLVAQGSLSSETFDEDDDAHTGECFSPDDLADFKLNAEVMLRGSCHAPEGQSITDSRVRFKVGQWSKTLRVVGPRVWSDRKLGALYSKPLAFKRIALSYSNAFGGEGFASNPAGKGVIGNELPTLEYPDYPIRSPHDTPPPASFGPLNPNWPQRAGKYGKAYGADYAKNRSPYYAEDFDWTYFRSAPQDQQLAGYLRGDERVEFHNMHPNSPILWSRLPGLKIRVFVKNNEGALSELPMQLDTLFADVDEQTVLLTWRGLGPVREDDLVDVKTVLIASEPLNEPLSQNHYHQCIQAYEADPLGLEDYGYSAKVAQRDDELAKLESVMQSFDDIGKNGDDKVGEDLVQLIDTASGPDADRDAGILKGFAAAADAKKENDPGSTSLAANINAQPAAPPYSPPPLKLPSGDGMPEADVPGLAEVLDKARDSMMEGHAQTNKALQDAGEEPRDSMQLDEFNAFLDDPFVQNLRSKPALEPGPNLNLAGQDYRGRDLRDVDMSGADLSEAILTGADLRGANLAGADLSHAVLYQANLSEANLSRTQLMLANFSEATATNADFSGAVIDRTLFDKACLDGAELAGMSGQHGLFLNTSMHGAKLGGVNLVETLFDAAELSHSDFANATLTACLFLRCKLASASLVDAVLNKTSFGQCEAHGARFVGANGERVVFLEAMLDHTDFSYAVLPNAFFSAACAKRANFYGADLKEARFYRSVLDRAQLVQANLFRADFRKAMLNHTDMSGANLFEATMIGAAGKDCNLQGANLTRCKFPTS